MMRAIGFLSGICLTAAALLLWLNSRESRPPAAATPAPTAEQLSQVVTAIAERVDLVPAANLTRQGVAPGPDEPLPAQAIASRLPTAGTSDATQSAAEVPAPDRMQQPGGQTTAETVASQPPPPTADNALQRADDTVAPAPGQQPDVPVAQADASGGQDDAAPGTYLFWSPFRSVWAAQGFARRLTAATQVPVEVVDGGPGNYRVAFSYRGELQRRARMDRITTITGLTLE